MMRGTPPAFLAFDRGLRADELVKAKNELERLGIEVPASAEKRGPGRPRKTDQEVVVSSAGSVWNTVKLPDELAAQVEAIAEALDLHRSGLARMIVAAGTEAILRQLEIGEGMTLPLRFDVTAEKPGFYRQHLRTVTPHRFEALRARYPWPLQKWKGLHPGDATGAPMPPPQSKILSIPRS